MLFFLKSPIGKHNGGHCNQRVIFPGKWQISHSRPHGGGIIQMQVRKTDSVNDRKGKANQLLIILLTQKSYGVGGAGERLGACRVHAREQLDMSGRFKGGEKHSNSGSSRYHIALGSIVCRLHCRIDKTLCGLVKEGWQVFHVSPLLGKDISRSLITTEEQSSLGVCCSVGRAGFYTS